MVYAILIPLGIILLLGLLFGLVLAFGPWKNPQTPEERKRMIEGGGCAGCAFMTMCHMDYDGENPEDCNDYKKEIKTPENDEIS